MCVRPLHARITRIPHHPYSCCGDRRGVGEHARRANETLTKVSSDGNARYRARPQALMLLCAINRNQLLHFLPKGGEGAEIGVAKGEFSEALLGTVQPRKLHLIDPWEHQEREDYAHDGNNVDAA